LGIVNLGYEKRNDFNLGAEAILFNSAWLDVNFFHEIYEDIITQRSSTVPEYLGGLNPYENYEKDKYTGFDAGLIYRNRIRDFHYELGGSFTYLKSKAVIRDEIWDNDYQYRAGKRTDGIWGLQSEGLFINSDHINTSPHQTFGAAFPGDIRYIDQNNDNIIDPNDIILIGNSIPDMSYGIHLKLSYKNLSLYSLVTGNSGHHTYFNNSYYWVYGDRKYSEVVLNRWAYDPDNGIDTRETASYPRLTSLSSSNNFRNSTFWLYDNSRININRIQLTYDLRSLASSINATNIGFYIKTENLAMIAKNREKIQLNHNSEPQYTSYSIGIRAIF
jgi:hypothetical protein